MVPLRDVVGAALMRPWNIVAYFKSAISTFERR